jgi:23S rRNA pseudouridine955/2504/2580 synthase
MSDAKNDTRDGVRQFNVGYDDDGIRLDRWFKRHLPETSFTTVAKWARTGQLRVDGSRATPGDRIKAGQTLRVPPPEPVIEDTPDAPRPRRERPPLSEDQIAYAREMVIHKDLQALVLNKPPGLATQGGTKTSEHVDGLLDALQYDAEGRPKLVHRLDKDTSGALLVARTSRAAAFFAKAFSGRTARKVYWALVVGVPSIDDGMVDLPIGKQPGTGGEKMHVDEENGQAARSRYRVIERAGNRCAWVELQPFTGRTHQLRVHMAAIGHPIVGDGKYGGAAASTRAASASTIPTAAASTRPRACRRISPKASPRSASTRPRAMRCRSRSRRRARPPRRCSSSAPRRTPSRCARNIAANAAAAAARTDARGRY